MKIAITGKMGSGKTTIANMIQQLDNRYEKISFAGKIKELAVDLFDMKCKDRELLINIGTKFREIDENVWINYVIKQTHKKNNKYVVLDDLRFQNELDILVKHGWKIINVDVNYIDQKNRIMNLYPTNYKDHLKQMHHISEKHQLNFTEDPILHINTSKDSFQQIKHELYLYLVKNK